MMDQGIDPGLVFPLIGMDAPWYYRNKMEFSFSDTADRSFGLGLHPSGYKYEVINLKECFLQSKFVSEFLPKIRQWASDNNLEPINRHQGFLRNLVIREGKRTNERLVELITSADDNARFGEQLISAQDIAHQYCEFMLETSREMGEELTSIYWTQYKNEKGKPTELIENLYYGAPVYHEELHLFDDRKLRFAVHPRAFFQPNPAQAEVIYRTTIERTGLRSTLDRSAHVLDLYCGTGTIGLCLAPYAKHVIGMEMQRDAVDNARRNAAFNGIENIEFFVGDVGKLLQEQEVQQKIKNIDVVVVDPPRAGLLPEACEHIQAIAAPIMVYVSCNPVSLVRDVKALSKSGYSLESIQPIDMFPHTYHVENVALLRRN
jgi:23S rRNA (uracil1939-C5)-methyltransferase